MAVVNLLPPELRTGLAARRSLMYPLLFLVLFSAIAGGYLRLEGDLALQAEKRSELIEGIAALQPVRIQRETLVRLEAELQQVVNTFGGRINVSAYSDEIARRLPAGVTIRDLRVDQQKVVIAASATTLAQIAQFISNFSASSWYREPSVGQITVGTGRADFQATLEIIRQPGGIPR